MGFVERIFHPVISAVERAFTPPGTGGQEAAAQQQAAAAAVPAALPPQPIAPQAPAAPTAPSTISPGAAPGASPGAKKTATTMLGAAALGGELAKASASGGQKNQKLG